MPLGWGVNRGGKYLKKGGITKFNIESKVDKADIFFPTFINLG